jgi:pyruvate, water dikinase
MSQVNSHYSTGLPQLDRALRGLIPGDNIVFRIDSIDDYQSFVDPYWQRVRDQGKRLLYFRFADHPPLLEEDPSVEICELDPRAGVERFTAAIHAKIAQWERGGWVLFDRLSDLAAIWHSDVMLANFFVLTCPYLYDVEAIAYFALDRSFHAPIVPTTIKDTAQVFLDVYHDDVHLYVHPLKVQQRHSPSMYMLHVWDHDDFTPVADSATTARVLGAAVGLGAEAARGTEGIWRGAFRRLEESVQSVRRATLRGDIALTDDRNEELMDAYGAVLRTAITRDPRVLTLLEEHFTPEDVLAIGRRIIGTGRIGGKSIGMLLARAVLENTDPKWAELLEVHDSFYIGSDVFYTFLVQNGLWWDSQTITAADDPVDFSQRLLRGADRARRRMAVGKFPEEVRTQLQTMLDYYGQSPIIVRSSSLLEDNFGHSFAGKYASIFLPNQGSREQRLNDFLSAVRTVYASTLSEEALNYRARRGMLDQDEQMAILVQRVSGSVRNHLFFPDMAGVGFSYNSYAWSKEIDPEAGVVRLVFGLGTRAVDRTDDDFPRVVALNAPEKLPVADYNELLSYAQRRVDVLDLQANQLVTMRLEEVLDESPQVRLDMIASHNKNIPVGLPGSQGKTPFPWVLTFDGLLKKSDFVDTVREMLDIVERAYETQVDLEFTLNLCPEEGYRINLVQCRPLQVKTESVVTEPPTDIRPEARIMEAHGAIVGQSRISDIDRIVYVVPEVYGQMGLRDRYAVAELVGNLVQMREEDDEQKRILLAGPGRWGTSSPSLGVPVKFHQISRAAVLAELVVMHDHLVPDVSLGTHFFNEMVEADILYFALFPDRNKNYLNREFFEQAENRLVELIPKAEEWAHAIKVIDSPLEGEATSPFVLYANSVEQTVVFYQDGEEE